VCVYGTTAWELRVLVLRPSFRTHTALVQITLCFDTIDARCKHEDVIFISQQSKETKI